MASFAFTKDSAPLERRESFVETLQDLKAHKETLSGYVKKLNRTGRWSRRFFVVHGHYLTYFKTKPKLDDAPLPKPQGSINLWHVASASLDGKTITLELSADASSQRKLSRQNSTGIILPATGGASSAAAPSSNPKYVLQAADSVEAQQWLTAMQSSPLLGVLAGLPEELSLLARHGATRPPPLRVVSLMVVDEDSGEPLAEFDEATLEAITADTETTSGGTRLFVHSHNASSSSKQHLLLRVAFPNGSAQTLLRSESIKMFCADRNSMIKSLQESLSRASRSQDTDDESSDRYVTRMTVPESGENMLIAVRWRRCKADVVPLPSDDDENDSSHVLDVLSKILVAVLVVLAIVLVHTHNYDVSKLIEYDLQMLRLTASDHFARGVATTCLVFAVTFILVRKLHGHSATSVPSVQQKALGKCAITGIELKWHEHHYQKSVLPSEGLDSPGGGAESRKKDVSITAEERQYMKVLRKRVADLYVVPESPCDSKYAHDLMKLWGWGPERFVETDGGEFRKIVVDKHVGTDFRCVRYLRARDYDLGEAEHMVRKSIAWRLAMRADDLIKSFSPPRWMLDYAGAPMFVDSAGESPNGGNVTKRISEWWLRDREGHAAMFFRNGRLDWRRAFRKIDHDGDYLIKCAIWALEMGRLDIDKLHEETNGESPSYLSIVVDLKGFSMGKQISPLHFLKIVPKIFDAVSTSYPELLRRVVVINTPWSFATFWNILVPFIPQEVREKIQIRYNWTCEKHLVPFFEPDNIPAYLGGELMGEEPGDEFCHERLPGSRAAHYEKVETDQRFLNLLAMEKNVDYKGCAF